MDAKHWMCSVLLAASLAPTVTARAETRRAVLVGIDVYEPPAASPSPRGWKNLHGSANDVEAMALLLRRRFGFGIENVRVLVNDQATRAAILEALRTQLVEAAAPGDISLFYYSGHGSQIRHAGSPELDQRDETLVPADWHRGAPDIRDKELATLWHDVLDRGARLDVIIDSCHSTSMQRGIGPARTVRSMEPDPSRVADRAPSDPRGDPVERGAVFLSAAQDFQNAMEIVNAGVTRGLFSDALAQAFRSAPLDSPVEELFLRTRGVMWAEGYAQEPSLVANRDRREAPLFGTPANGKPAVVAVAVLDAHGARCTIEGGLALGLYPGSILRRLGAPNAAPVRIEITELSGIDRAMGRSASGASSSIESGDLFEVERWGAPDEPLLRVWIPSSSWSDAELATRAKARVGRGTTRWVADPTEEMPGSVVGLQDAGATDGPAFLEIPASMKLDADLVREIESLGGAIEVTHDAASAQYLLTGRWTGERIEYAWVLPDATRSPLQGSTPLPVRSDWVPGTPSEAATRQLAALAARLAKVRGWLQLEPPPDAGSFPYRLVLCDHATGSVLADGDSLFAGRRVDPHLRAVPGALQRGYESRYVYAFVLDANGRITTLYPRGGGNLENYLPASISKDAPPSEISLPGASIEIAPPFGVDTYFLLSTRRPLPSTAILEGAPVTLRSKGTDPLARLLSAIAAGQSRGGTGVATAADWSLQRVSMHSLRPK